MWKDTDTDNPASQAARAMVDTFASAGADHFDITWTTQQGNNVGFRRYMPADTLRNLLPVMLSNATKNERNLIVRPVSDRAVFIQLDDLSREGLERVKAAAFLGLETSPGNYQAWVSIPAGQSDKDFARRLRKGQGPTIRRAAQPASPGASISRTSTRRISLQCKSPTAPPA